MIKESSQTYYFLWPHLCLTRLNEFRFFLTYFLRTSFKFSSMQSVECALKTRYVQRKNTPELMNDGIWCNAAARVVSKTKHSKTKTEARSTQISKTKHPRSRTKTPKSRKRSTLDRKRRPQNLENEAPKTRNHCRFNNCNFTSCMTQSKSGGGSGCVRTSKIHPKDL